MEEKSDWAGAALAVSIAAVTSIGASMALLNMVWYLPDRSLSFKEADPAAWVQAIGSVVAILVSAATVGIAHHLEKRRAAEADQDRHGTAAILLDDLMVRTEHAFEHIIESTSASGLRFLNYRPNLPRWLSALDALTLASRDLRHSDFGSVRDLRVYLDFRTNLEAAASDVRNDLAAVNFPNGLNSADFERRLHLLRKQQESVRESKSYRIAMTKQIAR